MGVKSKMSAGFFVIGLLLFLSGAITLFELNSMGRSVQDLLNDNLKSIEVSRQMSRASDQIGHGVLLAINGNKKEAAEAISQGERLFDSSYEVAQKNLTVPQEDRSVKSIDSCYTMLKAQADSAMQGTTAKPMDWYLTVFSPMQDRLSMAIDKLIAVNRTAIDQNVNQMKTVTNRAMMPGLIAIFVGIVFVVLFNYFVNIFFITPIVRITQGVENYVKHAIPFRVKVDSKDELERLKNSVDKLIVQNKSNKIDD